MYCDIVSYGLALKKSVSTTLIDTEVITQLELLKISGEYGFSTLFEMYR